MVARAYWESNELLGFAFLDRLFTMFRWCPVSEEELRLAEERLLDLIKTPHKVERVKIRSSPSPSSSSNLIPSWLASAIWDDANRDCYINTLIVDEDLPPNPRPAPPAPDTSSSPATSAAGESGGSATSASAVLPVPLPVEDDWGEPIASETSPESAPSAPPDSSAADTSAASTTSESATSASGSPEKQQRVYSSRLSGREGGGKHTLVMMHGYAAACGFYFRNYDALSQHFKIYAIDQLGWGASSRPTFTPTTPEEAENWFVESLEAWRKEMHLEEFVLLGHSFGGYIASRYALKYPEHVLRLVLIGPAGFNHESQRMQKFRNTWKGFVLDCVWETNTTPQVVMRLLGPWSRDLVKQATVQRWTELPAGQVPMTEEEVDAFTDYIFQTFLAPVSGELCMKYIFSLGAFARRPLIDSAYEWKVPTSFIYGQHDIMDYRAGLGAAKLMPVPTEVLMITNVGHMLFLENPAVFNAAVIHCCQDLLPPMIPEVTSATQTVEKFIISLHQCHRISLDGSEDSELITMQGSSGIRRLGKGWGIG